MHFQRSLRLSTSFLVLFGLAACSTEVSGPGRKNAAPGGSSVPGGGTAVGTNPVLTDTPTTPLPSGVSTTPGVPLPASGALGPVAVRRLSNDEYDTTLQDLLQAAPGTAVNFQPDARNLGYRNVAAALTVPLVVAEQYSTAAAKLAAQVSANAATLAPCAGSDAAAEVTCAESFITSFGANAFRRPLVAEEVTAYSKIFQDERGRTSYAEGIGAVAETLLQSPYFLYKTEMGAGTGVARLLTAHELATQISYLVTGTMPDPDLMAAANGNQLTTADQREAQARRLFKSNRTPTWLRGFVTQWTSISTLPAVKKDPAFFPTYDTNLQTAIIEESNRFVDAVFANEGGSLATLFTANWSILNPATAYIMGQMAKFVTRLKNTSEGNGTVLDNTLVLMISELSNAEQHSHENILCMTAGKASGKVRPGREIDYQGQPNNLGLRSILEVFGINQSSIGDANLNSGSPISLA